ncbi:MAG: hypothetical protein V4623_00335, partial [Pseudomonadota bacterium]
LVARGRCSERLAGAEAYLPILDALEDLMRDDPGQAIRSALENLQQKVYGVVTTYNRPFSKGDHEAISENLVITGEVQNAQVTYAYREDEKQAIVGRKQFDKK